MAQRRRNHTIKADVHLKKKLAALKKVHDRRKRADIEEKLKWVYPLIKHAVDTKYELPSKGSKKDFWKAVFYQSDVNIGGSLRKYRFETILKYFCEDYFMLDMIECFRGNGLGYEYVNMILTQSFMDKCYNKSYAQLASFELLEKEEVWLVKDWFENSFEDYYSEVPTIMNLSELQQPNKPTAYELINQGMKMLIGEQWGKSTKNSKGLPAYMNADGEYKYELAQKRGYWYWPPSSVHLKSGFQKEDVVISPFWMDQLGEDWEMVFIVVDVQADYPKWNKMNYDPSTNILGGTPHAILIVVNKKARTIKMYDGNRSYQRSGKNCFSELQHPLKAAFKKKTGLTFRYTHVNTPDLVDGEIDQDDCGVRTLFFAEHVITGIPSVLPKTWSNAERDAYRPILTKKFEDYYEKYLIEE